MSHNSKFNQQNCNTFLGLKNCNVITPFENINNCYVIIKKGKIFSIEKDISFYKKYKIGWIDACDNIVCPGFINLHYHGISGKNSHETDYESLNFISCETARSGITSYLLGQMGDGTDIMLKRLKDVNFAINKGVDGSKMLGVFLEGPYINIEKKGAAPNYRTRLPNLDEFKYFVETVGGVIKMVTIAPEIKGALGLIKYAKSQEIIISFGHTMATYKESLKILDEVGKAHSTHTFNAMRVFHHREPGILGVIFLDNRVTAEVICDLVHVHPKAIELLIRLKGIDNVCLITDGIAQTYLPDGKYVSECDQEIIVSNGTSKLKNGTIAGSIVPMNIQFRNLIKEVGISLNDAVTMASVNPAKVLNIFSEVGSLEVGKNADIVIMDKDMNVIKTIVGGRLVYNAN